MNKNNLDAILTFRNFVTVNSNSRITLLISTNRGRIKWNLYLQQAFLYTSDL